MQQVLEYDTRAGNGQSTERTLPRVDYDPELVSDVCPYAVIVNPVAVADILHNAETPRELIADLTISVDTIDPKRPNRLGAAYRRYPEIVLYAEPEWRTFRDAGRLARKNVRKERPDATAEELAFLDVAVDTHLADKATANLNNTAGHEIRHFLDFFHPSYRRVGNLVFDTWCVLTEVTTAGAILYVEEKKGPEAARDYAPHIERLVRGISYQIDPLEQRARRFAARHPSVRGQALVTFIPDGVAAKA